MIDLDDDAAFPLDPWAVIPPDLRSEAAERLADDVARLDRHYAAPRDEPAARRFLIETLPAGRLCLYGAGSMSARLLGWLVERPDIEVVAVIDRNAATLGRFHDRPVVTPMEWARVPFDRVLVAHPLHEPDMIATLRAAGLPAERILPLYDHPEFAAAALPAHRARIADALTAPVRHCIVGSSHLTTIPDEVLSRLLPAADTMLLYFSPYERFRTSPVYPTVDLASSTTLLAEALQQLAPDVVVLRTTSHLAFLAPFIMRILPDAVLLHDFYDFSNLLPNSLLHGWLAMSPAQVAIGRLAEYYSLRSADLVVSKRDGPWWDRMLAPTTRPYVSFFPGTAPALQPHAGPPKRDGEPWHVLYAGILLQPKPGEYAGDYNFLPLFETLSASGRFRFDLYNSAHADPTQDPAFQHFIERYPAAPMAYHRRVSYPEVHALSRNCHFGWLYREGGGEVSYDAATAIPARCLGYLNAGLPVILDDKWGYLEDLILRHHAGVILPQGEAARLPEILAACDLERLRAGAVSLLRFCLEHNEAAITEIGRHLHALRALKPARQSPERRPG